MRDDPRIRRDAEKEALSRMFGDPPDAETLLDLLERLDLSPAAVDLVARALNTDWRPSIAPPELFDPGFRRLYVAVVEAEAGAEPDPTRPPLSVLDEEALASKVAPGGDPATRRALKSAIPKWRGTEAYLEAVDRRRVSIDSRSLTDRLIAIERARASEAETRRMKEAFFLELMTRMQRQARPQKR